MSLGKEQETFEENYFPSMPAPVGAGLREASGAARCSPCSCSGTDCASPSPPGHPSPVRSYQVSTHLWKNPPLTRHYPPPAATISPFLSRTHL